MWGGRGGGGGGGAGGGIFVFGIVLLLSEPVFLFECLQSVALTPHLTI